MNQDLQRFQFSIARLLIATGLAALAACIATLQLPFKILPVKIIDQRTGAIRPIKLLSICAVLGLLGAAIGVIIKGQSSLGRAAYEGCVLLPFFASLCCRFS
jgi:hypothetical protein